MNKGGYGNGQTIQEIADSKQANFEAENRRSAKPAWRERHAQIEEIVGKRDAEKELDPKKEYASAIKFLDGSYRDLVGNPSTLTEFGRRLHARAIDAAEKGNSMSWLDEGSKIGEQMRQELGSPTSDERSRAEALAEFKRSRGQS